MEKTPSNNQGDDLDNTTSAWDNLDEKEVESTVELDRARARGIGKKVLGAINYQDVHREEVDAAYGRARDEGYKFSGDDSPAARRIEALLVEIEGRSGAENLELGRKSMERSIGELTDGFSEIVKEALESQLTDWSEYFGDESCELPEWFKMWSWQGMTKLGGYNTSKKRYDKRSKYTIHTFPPLDKEALTEVHNLLEDYYGGEEIEPDRIEGLDKADLKKCDFNALYSYCVNKHVVPTPESRENVRGGWQEYKHGQEDEVSRAANGTGWCIVSPSKAREYLERPESSFTFLHLENPFTGKLDYHACASIRMEDGKVAEISGRRAGSGQMLEDSLVEVVEDKVLSMPGGEKYRKAFSDRKELIRIYSKEEELTKEELEFVYEIYDRIDKLELHSVVDSHMIELKTKYGVEAAIEKGVDKDALFDSIISGSLDASINEENTIQNLEGLLKTGADPGRVLSVLSPVSVWNNFDKLVQGGVAIEQIVEQMGAEITGAHVEKLFEHGVSVDVILDTMGRPQIAEHIGTLLDHGANTELIMRKIFPEDVLENIEVFRAHGVEISSDVVLGDMNAREKMKNYDKIKEMGLDYDIYQAVGEIDSDRMWDALYQKDVRDFLFREDIDPIRFADSLSEENMEYMRHFVVTRLNNEFKKVSREIRKDNSEEKQSRVGALKAKIEELGGKVEDDWW